jgi:hypothetical protein
MGTFSSSLSHGTSAKGETRPAWPPAPAPTAMIPSTPAATAFLPCCTPMTSWNTNMPAAWARRTQSVGLP